jgi:ubiquitin-conjugating enzyme E2 N
MSVRIMKELDRIQKDPIPGISVCLVTDNNPRYLKIMLQGPQSTPYEDGIFELELYLPNEYPMVPPKVRFLTKVYHPNIDKLGRICLNILKESWTPALQIRTVLISIQALLSSPNTSDPLNPTVAKHWIVDKTGAEMKAREWVIFYANDKVL